MMTGLLHEKEFSRKSFVKGGGALIVGFSLAGSALAGKAAAAAPTPAGYIPDINQVDSWITIGADNTVTLKTSQIEVGNGITTGFLQVLAEELDMDMSQMYYGRFNNQNGIRHADTWVAVSTGGEGGSNAMSGTGPKIRNVGALARQALLGDGLDEARRAGREPVGRQGRRLRRRQVGHLRRARRRQAVQHQGRERRRCSRASRRRSRCRPTRRCSRTRTRSSGSTSRTR